MKQFYFLLKQVGFLFLLCSSALIYGQINNFNGNGNTGFGGFLGESGLEIDFKDSDPNITYFYLSPGIGPFNDKVVIYIDSDESGNFTNTFGFTDNGDPLRVAISGFNGTNGSALVFPPGFKADYAIGIESGFAGLWTLTNGGSHAFLQALNLFFDGSDYYFDLQNVNIGDPNSFKFFATYISGTASRSDEAIGEINTIGNPGFTGVEFDTYWTTDALRGGIVSTNSSGPGIWSIDSSWGFGNVPFETDHVFLNTNMSADIDVIVDNLTINSPHALTIEPGKSVTLTGNLNNSSNIILKSESNTYSSIIPTTTSGSGTYEYQRFTAQVGSTGTNDLVSAPVLQAGVLNRFDNFASLNSGILAQDPTDNDIKAYAPFNNDSGSYENLDVFFDDDVPLVFGRGYRAGTVSGQNLKYAGSVITTGDVVVSDFDIGTDPTFGKWNLIGNPYTSYINALAFLDHIVQASPEVKNVDLLEDSSTAIYGYSAGTDLDATGNWTIYNYMTIDANTLIAPGQGFFVAAALTATLDIEFSPDIRRIGSSEDFISRNTVQTSFGNVKLKAESASNDYSTDFYFNSNATRGLDPGYDASLFGGSAPAFSIYSHLVEENSGVPMGIQALGASDFSDVTIPLGIHVTQGEQVTVSMIENTVPSNINVYLEDNVANTFTLLNSSDYIFTPSSTLNSTGRFFLRFSDSALSTDDNVFNGISIYGLTNEKLIKVDGFLNHDTQLFVYDLQGRVVLSKTLDLNTNSQRIDATSLSTGIYVVELQNSSQTMTKKVIMK